MSLILRYLLCLMLPFLLVGCGSPEPAHLQGMTMGTNYSVLIPRLPEGFSNESLHEGIEVLLKDINQTMSTYIPDSELSRLNRSQTNEWHSLSPALFEVISLAQSVSAQTDGAFDITVGPLVNLWGFGPGGMDNTQAPDDDEIATAMREVGYQYLELNPGLSSLKKKVPGLYIDLSAIAKGHGVDAVAEYLDSLGVSDYLVEIGGEVRGKGLSHRGDPWRIAVEKPLPGQRRVHRVVSFTNLAIATSGDYRNYYEADGIRYSHTIDPRTGRPIDHALASVTVLSDRAVHADAWATALMVLGEDEGYRLAEEKGLAAYFLYKQGDAFLPRETRAFGVLTTQPG